MNVGQVSLRLQEVSSLAGGCRHRLNTGESLDLRMILPGRAHRADGPPRTDPHHHPGPRPHRAMQPPGRDPEGGTVRPRLRGVPADRCRLGAPADLHVVRARRLLRLLTQPPRDRPPPPDRLSDGAEHRARRDVGGATPTGSPCDGVLARCCRRPFTQAVRSDRVVRACGRGRGGGSGRCLGDDLADVGAQRYDREAASLGCALQTGAGAVLNDLRPEAAASLALIGAGAVGSVAIMAAQIAGCLRCGGVVGARTAILIATETLSRQGQPVTSVDSG